MEHATKEEMQNRIREHRAFRSDSDTVNLLWKGYLIALNEWEILSDSEYVEAVQALKDAGPAKLESPLLRLPIDVLEGKRLPTQGEIVDSIRDNLNRHANSNEINLIWRGYLAALQEWASFLILDEYHDLDSNLARIGIEEVREIFLGVPGQYE